MTKYIAKSFIAKQVGYNFTKTKEEGYKFTKEGNNEEVDSKEVEDELRFEFKKLYCNTYVWASIWKTLL